MKHIEYKVEKKLKDTIEVEKNIEDKHSKVALKIAMQMPRGREETVSGRSGN